VETEGIVGYNIIPRVLLYSGLI